MISGMRHNATIILTPLRYLAIRHESKYYFDYYFPFLSATLFLIFLFFTENLDNFFLANGIFDRIESFLGILVGFFATSLAVVSSFSNRNMDKKFDGKGVFLKIRRGRHTFDKILSRRSFLCYLFGYLVFLSMVMLFFGIISSIVFEKYVDAHCPAPIFIFGNRILVAIYIFLLFQLIFTMTLGLYYLIERIHRIEPQLVSKEEQD